MAPETIGLVIDVSAKGLSTLSSAKLNIISFNQALDLSKKAARAFSSAMDLTIGKSLEFRSKNDPVKKELEAFLTKLESFGARVGDMLTPALLAFSRVFTPVIDGLKEWATQQDAVRQKNIADVIATTAQVLVNSLAVGLSLANKGWNALNQTVNFSVSTFHRISQAIDEARAETQESFATQTDSTKAAAAGFRKMADLHKMQAEEAERAGLAEQNAADERQGFIDTQQQAFSDAIASGKDLAGILRGMPGLDIKGDEAEKRLAASAKAAKELDDAMKRLNDQADKFNARAIADIQAGTAAQEKLREDQFQYQVDLQKQKDDERKEFQRVEDEKRDETKRTADERESQLRGMAQETVGLFRTVGSGFDVFLSALLDKLISFLAEQALMGFFNIIFGPLTSGAGLFGNIFGGLFQDGGPVRGFAHGGLVTGGRSGRDSVPAMLTPGEYVLPADVVSSIQNGQPPSKRGRFASGGMVSGSGGMAPVQQNFMMFTHSRAAFAKVYRDEFAPVTKRLTRNRVIKAG